MDQIMIQNATKYSKRNRRKKAWQKVVSVLGCIVVFCTTYALILPAITQEREVFCGMEAHTHDDGCYGKATETPEAALICALEESEEHTHCEGCYAVRESHTHEEGCYVSQQGELICQTAQQEGHAHGAECYIPGDTLVCTAAEHHTHGDDCYTTGDLTCTTAENHAHADGCYQTCLVCQLAEDESHAHDDGCYGAVLTCGEPEGHIHGDGCFSSSLVCTEREGHIHDDSCFNQVLNCLIEENEGHTHTDVCYEQIQLLICGQEEVLPSDSGAEAVDVLLCELEDHTHELICYSDVTADVETAAQWERTIANVELTGVWAEDVLAIAESQLGYRESTKNYIVLEDGESMKGYSRYGAWYGSPYGDWCAMFVSFCLDYAGVEDIPLDAGCRTWIEELSAEDFGLYRTADSYTPNPGDLVFFDWEGDDLSDHVGLVEELSGGILKTIEGNSGNCVARREYEITDPVLLGYGSLPEYEAPVITHTAVIYTDGSYETLSDDMTVITLTGMIPKDAIVRAYPVELETEQKVLCAYDIAIILPDGTLFEPADNENVTVSIQSPHLNDEALDDNLDMGVFYVPEEGEPEWVDSTVTEDGISFDADHFSTYAVMAVDATLVNTQWDLQTAFNNGTESIQLGGDFGVYIDNAEGTDFGYIDGPLVVPSGKNVVLDLNGYTIWHHGSDALFSVAEGATLTIIDSKSAAVTSQTVSGSMAANTAEAAVVADNEAKVTLTYYVTESNVTDTSVGATQETLKEYTVTSSGTIIASDQPIFKVGGGTLNIQGGTFYGGTNRAIEQTSGTTNLSGGYLCGFTNENTGGAVNTTGGTLNISGSCVLAGNHSHRGGAVYASNTTVNMTGGIVSGNVSTIETGSAEGGIHYGGGGLYLDNSPTTISGGYITNNLVKSTGYFDGGGGILVCGTNSLTVNGGYITGNEASSGGGIRTNWQNRVTVTMNGGYVCSNVARSSEGGGISINIQATCSIVGGYINNNVTNTQSDWGGGGVFCSTGSTLYIRNALVTDNDAGGFGGGVAGCSTGRVYICVKQGGAIYNNSAAGKNMSGGTSTKHEDHVYAYNNEVFMNNGYQDYFCALNSIVEGAMLGGHAAGWTGSADGDVVMAGKDDTLIAAYVMGLNANPTAQAQSAAMALAKVYINGNSSNTHGGGILCNGYMIIGETESIDLGARIELKASKTFLGSDASVLTMEEGQFTFTVTDMQTGAVLATASNDTSGKINFKERLAFTEAGTFVYYIREVQGTETDIAFDTSTYRLTVEVIGNESVFDEVLIDGEPVTIMITKYQLDMITIEKQNGSGAWELVSQNTNPSNSDDSAVVLELTADATFTNIRRDEIEISVVKEWDDDNSSSRPGSVTVALLQNGSQYGDKISLSAANGWSYTWTELPVISEDGQTEYSYTVKEDPLPGYVTEYEILNNSQLSGCYWVPASSIVEGGQYMIVSSDHAKALMVSSNHENAAFTTADTVSVSTTPVTISGNTYQYAIADSQVPDRSIFRAEVTTTNSNQRVIFRNMGTNANSWLLAQENGSHYLKSTSGAAYASGVKLLDNGVIAIQNNWDKDNAWWYLTYESGAFDTEQTSNTGYNALLYTPIYSAVSTDTTIRITNRSTGVVTYSLDITKVSGINNDVLLAGAEFNLLDPQGEEALYFVMNSPGAYTLADSAAVGATQQLITNGNGKLVLRGLAAQSYILRETKAPNEHMPIDDMTVTLGQADGDGNVGLTLALTIVDEPISYELPETGGAGITSYTMAGLMLMLLSAAFLLYINRKRGREAY